ncbi:MAG: hypothetical protein NTV01_17240 [Bacteroidia bacterium]|nr:hypothetical protein [Bacteroidia bacterium]
MSGFGIVKNVLIVEPFVKICMIGRRIVRNVAIATRQRIIIIIGTVVFVQNADTPETNSMIGLAVNAQNADTPETNSMIGMAVNAQNVDMTETNSMIGTVINAEDALQAKYMLKFPLVAKHAMSNGPYWKLFILVLSAQIVY